MQLRRGGVDLVEEDGAGVGGLEAAGAVVDGPGERPADVAEELAFQEVLGQRAAVDANERAAAARTEPVDRLGDQLLARARLAQQQHRGVRLGHLPREAVDVLHRRAGADQTGDRRAGVGSGDGGRRSGHVLLNTRDSRSSPSGRGLGGEPAKFRHSAYRIANFLTPALSGSGGLLAWLYRRGSSLRRLAGRGGRG